MTDYHVITHKSDELVMQVIDDQLVIVPPAAPEQPETNMVLDKFRSHHDASRRSGVTSATTGGLLQ